MIPIVLDNHIIAAGYGYHPNSASTLGGHVIISFRILGTEVFAFDLTTAQQERESAEREERSSKTTGLPFGFSGGATAHLETDYRDTSEDVQA